MDSVELARAIRTDWLNEDPSSFRAALCTNLDKIQRLADRDKIQAPDLSYAARLNTFTDIRYELSSDSSEYGMFPEPINPRNWPSVQFYDYTKFPRELCDTSAPNYDLTYSDRHPKSEAKDLIEIRRLADYLATGERIAVVLSPNAYAHAQYLVSLGDACPLDFRLIDGNRHDARFTEPSALVFLSFKGSKADQLESDFPRNLASFQRLLSACQTRHSLFA